MISRSTAGSILAWISHYSGISALFFLVNRRRKRIITYHNVLPDSDFTGALHEGVSHTVSIFQGHIDYLRRYPCDLSLDDRSSVTVTFDDGYLNQYTLAHPILKEAGIQAYFFIPVVLLENDHPLAVDLVLFWLSRVPAGSLILSLPTEDGAPLELTIASDEDRLTCWQVLNRYLHTYATSEETVLAALERCVPFETIKASVSEDYYQLRFGVIPATSLHEMKAYGHLIGPHSQAHRVMAALDDDALEADVSSCAGHPGFNSSVFSYPFGGLDEVTPRVVERVRSHGFPNAVSNINIPLTGSMSYGPHFLPRLSLPNTDKSHVLSFVLSGAKYFLQHGRRLPDWK